MLAFSFAADDSFLMNSSSEWSASFPKSGELYARYFESRVDRSFSFLMKRFSFRYPREPWTGPNAPYLLKIYRLLCYDSLTGDGTFLTYDVCS